MKQGSKEKSSGEETVAAIPREQKQCSLLEAELLKKIDLFGNFSDDAVKTFVKNCNEIVLKEGEILFEEGLPADKMYIILSGQMSIHKAKKRIAILQAGDFVGEMSLIESMDRSATAAALSKQVLVIEVGESQFQQFLTSDPYALFSMMKTLSSRIRDDLNTMSHEMQRLSNFTHDMRNCLVPLGVAETYLTDISEFLHGTKKNHAKRKGWDKVKRSFDTIQSVKNNLMVMIDQSLACVKKIHSEYVKAELEIKPLIEETVEEISCHKLLRDKNIQIVVNEDIPKGFFNCLDIKRVMQNLLINAGYASVPKGKIDIGINNSNGCIQVSVRDYGTGIPDDVKPMLLKDPYTTKPDGNGFGLMSCREIIEDFHQGEIFFESRLNEGTTFYFTIGKTP